MLCEEGTVSTETGATSCTSCDLGKEANSDKTQCGKYPFTFVLVFNMKIEDLNGLIPGFVSKFS